MHVKRTGFLFSLFQKEKKKETGFDLGSLNINAPTEQTLRCLERFLKEKKLMMSKSDKNRLAALMAQYFEHEDEVKDVLVYNYLNMIYDNDLKISEELSAQRLAGIEYCSRIMLHSNTRDKKERVQMGVWVAVLSVLIGVGIPAIIYMTNPSFVGDVFFPSRSQSIITMRQVDELKELVDELVELKEVSGHEITHSTVWSQIKKSLNVLSYKHISQDDYDRTEAYLKNWIEGVKTNPDFIDIPEFD